MRLTEVGLTAEYHFEIVYGISRNRLAWWDNTAAYELGYKAANSADGWIPTLRDKLLGDPLADTVQGGSYVTAR